MDDIFHGMEQLPLDELKSLKTRIRSMFRSAKMKLLFPRSKTSKVVMQSRNAVDVAKKRILRRGGTTLSHVLSKQGIFSPFSGVEHRRVDVRCQHGVFRGVIVSMKFRTVACVGGESTKIKIAVLRLKSGNLKGIAETEIHSIEASSPGSV